MDRWHAICGSCDLAKTSVALPTTSTRPKYFASAAPKGIPGGVTLSETPIGSRPADATLANPAASRS
eukprot:7391490-Prymnesium_polylepis.2